MFFAPQEVVSLLENYQQNAPDEKVSLNLSSGDMKCFDPQQNKVWSSRNASRILTQSDLFRNLEDGWDYDTSSQNRVLGQKNVDMKIFGTWFRWEM